VFTDWTLAMFLKRETVGLSQMENPREAFFEAAAPAIAPSEPRILVQKAS
jgi:NADH:ubiquinone reductase (H+-translocating)